MASFYQYTSNSYQQTSPSSHSNLANNQNGRGRRTTRLTQNSQKPIRVISKEEEPVVVMSFRQRYEAGRSFDLDDDLEFCPGLITDIDFYSIHSASDQSSYSSESPESSPQSHQVSPSSFHLNSSTPPYLPISSSYHIQPSNSKLEQPSAASARIRNAVLIVNPNSSNDPSRSPDRQHISFGRRW